MKIKDLKQFQAFIFENDVKYFKYDKTKFPDYEVTIFVKLNEIRFCGTGIRLGNTFLIQDFSHCEIIQVGY